jgi:outer membrane protein OmpA-like peptidoglycan-associated protein/opacity protein-like surface antigen
MITRLTKPVRSVLLCGALCLGTAAFAQDAATGNPPKPAAAAAVGGDEHPDLIEIDPFGGISIYGQMNRGLTMHTADGGVGGIRLTYNPSRYLGLELWADYAGANVRFLGSPGPFPAGTTPAALVGTPIPPYSFGAHNWIFGFNPVLNLRPRGSRVQPYVTVGVTGIQFTPSQDAQFDANTPANAVYHAGGLNDNLQVGVNYGGGVKFHFTDHLGMRFDLRGITSRNPTYDLPNSNMITTGVYIPAHSSFTGIQATAGLVFFAGTTKCPPMPAAPPPPAPLPTPTISGGDGTICQGKPVMLHATLPGAPADHKLSFAWTVNGQAQDANSPDLTFTPNNTGSMSVQLTVTDTTPPPPPMERPKKFPVRCWVQPAAPPPVAPVTATATLTVGDTTPTISSVTATPTELACAANTTGVHSASLSGTAQAAACGGNLTYKWTVSEGSVTNDSSPNATFDASSLNFEAGSQAQSKSVTATLTVTDPSGKSATQTTSITVKCEPTFVRLDDVIFAKNNARVNNCGKRLLIDDAASRMASGDYDIILVGHRDTDEKTEVGVRRKGRHASEPTALDEQRALNAAAVLSGGTGTCGKVDPARVKIDWVGTDQTSETKLGQCGTSATKATERKGSEVTEADKNRRVEVYLVPHSSSAMPPAVKSPKPLPEATMKSLGCPK